MSALPPTRPPSRRGDPLTSLRDLFWVVALGVIACYAFFVALGAFSPGDVVAVTVVVALLLVLWLGHAWLGRRQGSDHDPRMTSARERRGF